jgi:ketosteroid isomerase-like protein
MRPQGWAPSYAPPMASSDPTEIVERMWAHEQIRQLASHYAVAVDSRDLDALVVLFVDDVRVGRDTFGRDALRASFAESLGAIGISMLNVGTHAIDLVDADHATGLVYCHAQIQDGERWIHQFILYRDTYERRDDQWLFVRRIHELWYGEEAVNSPMSLPLAEWPKNHDGFGTVPDSWPSWAKFWATRA